MWDRVKLKESAKQVLGKDLFGKKWLMSALASFIQTTAVGAASSIVSMPVMIIYIIMTVSTTTTSVMGGIYDGDYSRMVAASSLVTSLVSLLISTIMQLFVLVATVFVTAPLDIGLKRYFLALRDPYDSEPPSIGLIFSCFKKGQYMKAVKGWGVTSLLISLWMLIPYVGTIIYLIKFYEYFYVPYIMADNPDIDRKFATTVSSQMTNGEKGNIFIMTLSFLGWQLLGSLIYIGTYWVLPYEQASFANLYDFAKRRAIGTGLYRPEVFGIYPQGDPQDPYTAPFDINAFYTRNRNYSRGCY